MRTIRGCVVFALAAGVALMSACSGGGSFPADGGGTTDADGDADTRIIPDPNTPPDACLMNTDGFDWQQVDCDTIAEGEPFYGQDGSYAEPARQPSYTDNGDGTVTDNLTHLTWTRCVDGTDADDDNSCAYPNLAHDMTYDEAVAECAGKDTGGIGDWRLPTISELWSVQYAGSSNPTLDPVAFPNAPPVILWSSTPISGATGGEIWGIYVEYSHFWPLSPSEDARALCVSGPSWPGPRLEAADEGGEPVVIDRSTGFMWQQCQAGLTGSGCAEGESEALGWEDALAYCEGLSYAGHDDWRLPDRHELLSLVDHTRAPPVLDMALFPNASDGEFITANVFGTLAFCVEMLVGKSDACTSFMSGAVRCVRGQNAP